MSPRGFAPSKIDSNQVEIVQALRQCGYWVEILAAVGHGWPDLFVVSKADTSRVMLLEVKGRAGRMTDDEKIFFSMYPGRVRVVRSPEEAIETMLNFDQESDDD